MQTNLLLEELDWRNVPYMTARLVKEAAGPYQVLKDVIPHLPVIDAKVWYSPDKEATFFSYPLTTDTDKVASWHIAFKQIPGVEVVEHGYHSVPPTDAPYIRVKYSELQNKDIFQPMSSALQLQPNALNKLWGGPNPLAATLAGGLLGATGGYAGGWLAEQLLPEELFERGKLRRTGALLGGGVGALPGAWWGYDNMRSNPDPEKKWSLGSLVSSYPWPEKKSRFTHIKEGMAKVFPADVLELAPLWEKSADETGATFNGAIPVDQFNRVIWNDLRSQGGGTDPGLAAATTGLLQAASLSQGGTNYITPFDVARIGIGMGSGYLSGMLVGKTLGALAGLRPAAQQTLQQSGAWAGVLTNTVPLLFKSPF
jgi:hypothetical protein